MAQVMHRSSSDGGSSSGWSEAAGEEERAGWEVRPSGMVVQARDRQDGGAAGVPPRPPPPEIRVRVKYGAARHEVAVSSIATFGELKKALAGRTGLHPADQQVTYKGRERSNSDYLDACGVKNKSKLLVSEDPASLERRYIERQRTARIQTAHRARGRQARRPGDEHREVHLRREQGGGGADHDADRAADAARREAGEHSRRRRILLAKEPPGEAGTEVCGGAGHAEGVQRAAAAEDDGDGGGDDEMGDLRQHPGDDAVGALRLKAAAERFIECSSIYTRALFDGSSN